MQNTEILNPLAAELPEAVRENALNLVEQMGSVVEGVGDEPITWRPPFLRLVQGTTDRTSIPRDARIGDFVIGEEKVEAPFKFIPLRMWDGRQFWDPDQNNNKMLCWSPDAKLGQIGKECRTCPHGKWDETTNKSECGKFKGLLAISADLSKVFTIQFAKSNYKIGMELEGMLKKAAVNPFQRVYGLTSATNPTAKNVENFKIEALDEKSRRTEAAYLPFLKELFTTAGADRKAAIDAFYENVAQRREQLALSGGAAPSLTGPAQGEAGTTGGAGTSEGGDSDITIIEVKPADSKPSETTISYQV